MITRAGCRLSDRFRTVRRGLSIRIVSAPTRIASDCARNFCACRRAAVPVIQRDSFFRRVKRPSKVIPHFAITNGMPVAIHLLNASFKAAHSSASTPVRTSIPASRKSSIPRPRCRGLGSVAPMTTDRAPERIIWSVHGPVRPLVEQGSSVTYNVAFLGTVRRKLRRHSVSA